MDSGNFLPPTQIPKDIMQNYAMNSEQADDYNNLPEQQLPNSFFMNNGGKLLTALIVLSAIIFVILFYDSIHIENKLIATTPDKVQLIMDHLKIKQ